MGKHVLPTPAPDRTVYAVAYQSVDDEEASIGGVHWQPSLRLFNTSLPAFTGPHAVDFEYLVHELVLPEDMFPGIAVSDLRDGQTDEVTEWVDSVAWDRPPRQRFVIVGSEYPGGEQRRLAEQVSVAPAPKTVSAHASRGDLGVDLIPGDFDA